MKNISDLDIKHHEEMNGGKEPRTCTGMKAGTEDLWDTGSRTSVKKEPGGGRPECFGFPLDLRTTTRDLELKNLENRG